jgi:16S rRNA U1498 N3-methylase RsmE
VMIGPEGGFVPFEIELAQANGARPVHLGERTLSVDTALSATLAQGSAVFALRSGQGLGGIPL